MTLSRFRTTQCIVARQVSITKHANRTKSALNRLWKSSHKWVSIYTCQVICTFINAQSHYVAKPTTNLTSRTFMTSNVLFLSYKDQQVIACGLRWPNVMSLRILVARLCMKLGMGWLLCIKETSRMNISRCMTRRMLRWRIGLHYTSQSPKINNNSPHLHSQQKKSNPQIR